MKLIGLSQTKELAQSIASSLNLSNYDESIYTCTKFADGEIEVSFNSTLRGEDVYLVQSTINSDSIIELLMAIDAAKHASAKSVIAVIPYFGYARQDRKSKPRISVGAKVIAKCLEAAGASRVITIDLHAAQEQCFFDISVDHIPADLIFKNVLDSADLEDTVIASPDMGGAKRAERYAKDLNLPLVICHKHRSVANQVDSMMVIGDVFDKNVILFDDMIDTAGTICKAASLLKGRGARSVSVFATHGVFSGPAFNRIEDSEFDSVHVTDTIPNKPGGKIQVHSCANMLAQVISRVDNNKTISDLFNI